MRVLRISSENTISLTSFDSLALMRGWVTDSHVFLHRSRI